MRPTCIFCGGVFQLGRPMRRYQYWEIVEGQEGVMLDKGWAHPACDPPPPIIQKWVPEGV